ncbi:ShlB/FhaC/HecB family hemolysin secretion/activation protein [Pelorhabdus rhamnosifermentans]|uniref:ShlB/FhaC/HecB family hemolysin secretion/activation protein n=1 Tax=Pelorhabdus rhamnosifermentans TaxID=2772457 RepID=UPI001C0640E0|nr:ShlB/FhaC/HecB family hemolysin secretion/activation protein [Pelorhabdus rhamnosifermentans]
MGDREEQNQRARQDEQARQQRQQNRDVFLKAKTPLETEEALPKETPSFFVKTVQIEGPEIAQFIWLSQKAAHYNGQMIGKEGINLIVKRLNNALIDRGYITSRVMVPEQDLSQGVLRFVLVVGTIGDIRFDPPMKQADWHLAFPTKPGDILNLRDLEQGLEQLKRIPSQDADFKLTPGKQPDQTDIVINLKRTKPWKVIYSIDDSGEKPTGRLQNSATLSVDNLFGLNDLFYIGWNRDAEGHHSIHSTKGNSINWSFPAGYWTYSFSSWNHNYKQTFYNAANTLVYIGDSRNLELKAERVIDRTQNSKTKLNFGVLQNWSHNYIDNTEIMVQRKQTTALEFGLSQRRYVNQDVWDYQLSYHHGMAWFGAQSQAATPDGSPTTRYGLWILEVDLTKPVVIWDTQARYNLTWRGQYTNSTLYATDCFSIGNRYTVRGFDGEQTLLGERGWYCRNELAFPLDQKGREIYGGLDYGVVSGPSAATLTSHELLGAVVGLRGAIGQGNFDVFVGWPLKEPHEFGSQNPTYGFQYTYAI